MQTSTTIDLHETLAERVRAWGAAKLTADPYVGKFDPATVEVTITCDEPVSAGSCCHETFDPPEDTLAVVASATNPRSGVTFQCDALDPRSDGISLVALLGEILELGEDR